LFAYYPASMLLTMLKQTRCCAERVQIRDALILSLASEPLAADKARQAISRGLALVFRFSGFSAPPREHESESAALKPPHCFRGGAASKPAVE
jgi:hypothetical protein